MPIYGSHASDTSCLSAEIIRAVVVLSYIMKSTPSNLESLIQSRRCKSSSRTLRYITITGIFSIERRVKGRFRSRERAWRWRERHLNVERSRGGERRGIRRGNGPFPTYSRDYNSVRGFSAFSEHPIFTETGSNSISLGLSRSLKDYLDVA